MFFFCAFSLSLSPSFFYLANFYIFFRPLRSIVWMLKYLITETRIVHRTLFLEWQCMHRHRHTHTRWTISSPPSSSASSPSSVFFLSSLFFPIEFGLQIRYFWIYFCSNFLPFGFRFRLFSSNSGPTSVLFTVCYSVLFFFVVRKSSIFLGLKWNNKKNNRIFFSPFHFSIARFLFWSFGSVFPIRILRANVSILMDWITEPTPQTHTRTQWQNMAQLLLTNMLLANIFSLYFFLFF